MYKFLFAAGATISIPLISVKCSEEKPKPAIIDATEAQAKADRSLEQLRADIEAMRAKGIRPGFEVREAGPRTSKEFGDDVLENPEDIDVIRNK